MPESQPLVADTFVALADVLEADAAAWDHASLCAGWQVRHVIAHVTMPARLTPEQFGAEMAAAGGDFTAMSDAVAARDASLPDGVLLAALRSHDLHAWQPPGGGADGALSHAVIHSLDITVAMGRTPVAPDGAVRAVLEQLAYNGGDWFGVDLDGVRLESPTGWSWGTGEPLQADEGELVALLSARALPDGRSLPRRS